MVIRRTIWTIRTIARNRVIRVPGSAHGACSSRRVAGCSAFVGNPTHRPGPTLGGRDGSRYDLGSVTDDIAVTGNTR